MTEQELRMTELDIKISGIFKELDMSHECEHDCFLDRDYDETIGMVEEDEYWKRKLIEVFEKIK